MPPRFYQRFNVWLALIVMAGTAYHALQYWQAYHRSGPRQQGAVAVEGLRAHPPATPRVALMVRELGWQPEHLAQARTLGDEVTLVFSPHAPGLERVVRSGEIPQAQLWMEGPAEPTVNEGADVSSDNALHTVLDATLSEAAIWRALDMLWQRAQHSPDVVAVGSIRPYPLSINTVRRWRAVHPDVTWVLLSLSDAPAAHTSLQNVHHD